jgi:hypothetical protein
MEIYIASFAGLLSTLLLAVVYLADRYEREPIELIQNFFLSGLVGQLVLVFAAAAATPELFWAGPWVLVTLACAAVYLPFQLRRQPEMDERFDGIVYAVSFVGGATCVIHLNNLPLVIAASPYHDALAPGAEPDLRDLLILAGSPGFAAELGRGFFLIVAAVLIGAVIGVLQLRGWPPWRTAVACLAVALSTGGLELAAGSSWPVRGALAVAAVAAALALKRRSVFRDRPEAAERDQLVLGLKTVLLVLGATLLATVLLRAVVDQPDPPSEPALGQRHSGDLGSEQGP